MVVLDTAPRRESFRFSVACAVFLAAGSGLR